MIVSTGIGDAKLNGNPIEKGWIGKGGNLLGEVGTDRKYQFIRPNHKRIICEQGSICPPIRVGGDGFQQGSLAGLWLDRPKLDREIGGWLTMDGIEDVSGEFSHN